MLAHIEGVDNPQSISTDNILWVVNAQAKVLAKVSFNRADLNSVYWLDNERLIIDTEKYGTLLVVNPFTGEQQIVSNELPNLFTYFNPWPMWRVAYSPDLEWVVYYGGQRPPEGPVVRDVVKNQNLWQVKGEQRGWPVWSPDGREVAIVGGVKDTQLYLIARSGQTRPILSEYQPHNTFAPSWSPDGKYLVFWDNGSLMVYEKHTNIVIDLCIPWVKETLNSATLYWSTNSQQFIVTNTGLTTFIPGSVLVDLQKKVAYKIKDIPNTFIVGWMNSMP
jgi:Tol biopolymer transport system component